MPSSTASRSLARLAVFLAVAVLLGATPAGTVVVGAPVGQADATGTDEGAFVATTDDDASGDPFDPFDWADEDEEDDESVDDDESEDDSDEDDDGDEETDGGDEEDDSDDGSDEDDGSEADAEAHSDDATTPDGSDDDPIERILTAIAGDSDDGGHGPSWFDSGDGTDGADGREGDENRGDDSGIDGNGADASGSDDRAGSSRDGESSASGGASQQADSDDESAADDESQQAPAVPADAGDGFDDPAQVETPTSTPVSGTPTAGFHVENATVNRSTVVEGEPVRITATVVNPTSTTATRRVPLRLFGEVVDARNVTVPTRSTRQVSFVRRVAASGTYEASVNGTSVTFTVVAGETATSEAGTTEATSQQAPGFTVAASLLALLVTVWWARRRR